MKTPALLLGAALIFWGWQTGLWIIALPMALVFEGSRLIRLRWDLSAADFRRVSDLCTILFIVLLLYFLMSDGSTNFIIVLLKWLPVVFFPLLAAQAYATSDRIDMRALFLIMRKKKQKVGNKKRITLNLTYPYFAICILSASTANVRGVSFYVGFFVLLTLTFWFVRSKRFSPVVWICLLAIAGSLGVVGHVGLHHLQLTLEQKGLEWFGGLTRKDSDPFQTRTAIGEIASLKPSNRIIFRVEPDGGRTSSMLLREATYNRFLFSVWVISNPGFISVQPDKSGTTWRFGHGPANGSAITVFSHLHKGEGVLKLPDGVFQVDRLPVVRMEKNKLGTVKVKGGPGLVSYRVRFGKRFAIDSPPTEDDFKIPDKEKPALNKILNELRLEGKPPQEIKKSVGTFFQKKFRYSLDLTGQGRKQTPLSAFLLQTRSGHCEYFATATVLLLRAAGIPARYAKGYSVHEFSRLENRFIVRDRDAHAWTRVYIDGAWHEFDTTPASWVDIEAAAADSWGFISDLWSLCSFKLSMWLWRVRASDVFKYLWWPIIPFIFVLARRFYLKKRVQRIYPEKTPEPSTPSSPAGSDSEFYSIEKALTTSGFARQRSETFRNWIGRLKKSPSPPHLIVDLRSILDLHYRYRFDPEGIQPAERERLRSDTQLWLSKYRPSKTDKSR